jgi:hypothetical protein
MYARLSHQTAITLTLIFIGSAAATAAKRTWTDNTGRFSVEAEVIEMRGDTIVLKKANGATAAVPLARLSQADREYLQTLATPAARRPGAAGRRTPLAFPDALTEPPAWANASTPFDLAAYLRAPPPEVNAAPLYLEAFAEIDSEMMYLTFGPYGELSAEEQEKYKRVLTMFRDRWLRYEQFEQAWDNNPSSVDAAEVDAWLAQFDEAFRKLAAAQQRPTCVFQTGYSVATLLPHIQIPRQVARAVAWRTRRDIQRGDLERPLADLKVAWEPMEETVLARLLIPAEAAVLHGLRRSVARFAGVECLVALRRWQLKYDHPPPDLETLVQSAGMPSAPADPFSDQPLRLGAVDGQTVIYSVGPDHQDDEAQVEWDLDWRHPGDFVFRLDKSID